MPGNEAPSFFPALIVAASLSLLCGCGGESPGQKLSAPSKRDDYTHPKELRTGEDGLVYRNDETEPYTGAVTIRDDDWNMRYIAYYQEGKLHGPEIKFWEDGKIRRNFDYERGEKVRHREWFANGNPKTDAFFVDGKARGPHRTWFEDGSPRWSGNFVGELQWDGHIVDYAPGGKLMWDAIFDHGRYISGVYPESEQEKLIEAGMLKPENAMYPRKPKPQPAETAPESAVEKKPRQTD